MTIMVPIGPLGPGDTVSIDYEMAEAPVSPSGYTFDAAEQSGADGSLTSLAASPEVNVTPSIAGSSSPSQTTGHSFPPPPPSSAGSMTVSPAQVPASRASTLTFSYTAPRAGLSPSGEITVDVPAGWAVPSASPGQAGYASSNAGVLSVSGRRITVAGATLASGQKLTIIYTVRAAPSSAGLSTFVTSERSDGKARLTALSLSPSVTVALTGATGGSTLWPVIWLVIGLAAAVSSAGVLASRRGRPRKWAKAGSSVQARPHQGPPTSVVIHDTGTHPTLIVRIEPHASPAAITIRGDRT